MDEPDAPRSAKRALRALAARVDDFERAAVARGADLRCGSGCEACCHVSLSLAPLEADRVTDALGSLDAETLAALDARRSDPRVDAGRRCVMLGDDGRCAIYESRPLVCRSQGLALVYPPGVVPPEAVMATLEADDDGDIDGDASIRGDGGIDNDGSTTPQGDLVWCPLNFTTTPPSTADVLDAGRLDEALAVLNRAFAGADALARTAMTDLVARAARGSGEA